MLGWWRGSQAPAANGDPPSVNTNTKDAKLKPIDTTFPPPEEPANDSDFTSTDDEEYDPYDVTMPPQTPPAMFALKAFRTAILGTPAPPKPSHNQVRRKRSKKKKAVTNSEEKSRPAEQKDSVSGASAEPAPTARRTERPDPPRSSSSQDSDFGRDIPKNPIPFKIGKRSNLFDRSSSSTSSELPPSIDTNITTPVKAPPSPTKGILVTPGATINGRKKTVSFHKSVPNANTEAQNARIRSGLPQQYPGKFPSPWTPKSTTPDASRSSWSSADPKSEKEKEGPKGKQPVKRSTNSYGLFDIGEDSRIDDYLDESDNDKDPLPTSQDTDITSDMDAPRSASGKFWKERTETLEDLAVQKLEKLRTRCKIATNYAKKKDELCVDLGEKLREIMETNQMLKTELKRLHQNPTVVLRGDDSDAALRSAMVIIEEKSLQLAASHDEISRMQTMIGRYEHKLTAFQEMLDQRENELTEMSMSLYQNDEGENLRHVVDDLKKKLRRANAEIREMKLMKLESDNLKSRVEGLEKSYADIMNEKEKLESELRSYREDEGNKSSASIRSNEHRLRQQIEALEKAKRDLRIELRNKTAEDAKEKRETERKFRAEVAEIKTDLASIRWEKEKASIELQELKSYVERVEKELERTVIERDDFKKKATSYGNGFWEKATTQELRDAKQENEKKSKELEAARRELENLKNQLGKAPPSSSPTTPGKPTDHEGSNSDDSALDRSFDRTTTATATATTKPPPSSFTARKPSISVSTISESFLETPKPSRTHRPLSPMENTTNNSTILPDPPAVSPAQTTFSKKPSDPSFDESNFYRERQKKASPRASIVSMAITPPHAPATAGGRKVSGVGRVVGRTGRAVANMDPAKRAAAEKRLAEKRKARLERGKENTLTIS